MEILHNINMERSVLASIFHNPDIFEDVAGMIKSKVFYLPAHRNIFEAMEYCERKDDMLIDKEFVEKKLNQDKNFDESVMMEIIATGAVVNFKAYVKELEEKYLKREFVKLSTDINDVAVDKDLPVKEVVDIVQRKLFAITQENNEKEFKESPQMAEATLEHIYEMKKRGNEGIVGLDTGFRALNRLTTGFGDGDLVIVAARPAMGKTTFCLNIAQKALDLNKGVAFFSLEMPAEQLMLRMLSAKTSIPLQNLRIGNLNDDEWGRLGDSLDTMSKTKLFVDDNQNVNIHQVRAKLRKLKMKHPEVSLCVIDYLQLMIGSGNKDRHLEVSDISRGLKLLARELNMPIIALSQLNRSLESRGDKRPMLSDLRESGAIEQDADMILFVYRDDVYRIREEKEKEQRARLEGKEYKSDFFEKEVEDAEVIIGKNRNGPTGVAQLVFHKKYTRFNEKEDVKVPVSVQSFKPPEEKKIEMPNT